MRILRALAALFVWSMTGFANAAPPAALIVTPMFSNAYQGVQANLTTELTNAGYTVTVPPFGGLPPGSLSSFKQIWDVRHEGDTGSGGVMSPSDRAAYVSYLQGGGRLFVMGENGGIPAFLARNQGIVDLVSAAGGGTTSTVTGLSGLRTQTVNPPFHTTPNTLTTVQYAAPGGLTSGELGSGYPITEEQGYATAVAWGPGSLTQAPLGSLIAVFDVGFLSSDGNFRQQFVQNLIGYLDAPTPTPVNGVCGTANGVATLIAPTANLCSAGTASSVTGGASSFTWSCSGSGGGTTASCSAPRQYAVTTSTGANGAFNCTSPVVAGITTTCTATPATGYRTASISGCGGTATAAGVNSYTTGAINADCTVTASFEQAVAEAIPTLSEWAMIFMASLMAMFGYTRLRSRRS